MFFINSSWNKITTFCMTHHWPPQYFEPKPKIKALQTACLQGFNFILFPFLTYNLPHIYPLNGKKNQVLALRRLLVWTHKKEESFLSKKLKKSNQLKGLKPILFQKFKSSFKNQIPKPYFSYLANVFYYDSIFNSIKKITRILWNLNYWLSAF